jgi:lysozyme family protein
MTATVHFDSSVQHRVYARLFQEAIGGRPVGSKDDGTLLPLGTVTASGVKADGIIGDRTLDLLAYMVKHHGDEAMAVALLRRRIAYYKTLPVYPENKHGWRRRINLVCAALTIPPLWAEPV